MSHRITSVAWIVALFVALGLVTVAFGQDDKGKSKDKAKGDAKFVQQAAMAGNAEVKMGQLAVEKATNDDVKKFAQQMIDDHTKANDELKTAAQQKNMDVPTDLGKHQKDYDKLSAMSGSDFDKAYVDSQVKAHKEVVAMFQKQSEKGDDADLKAWAAQKLPTLQMHLQHAQDLQKAMK